MTAPIVFSGSFVEVQDHFEREGWSDGLPIVPPTVDAVAEMLRCTDRESDVSLGTVQPSGAEATVWSVAVNGVMAGCHPCYMPVLVAVVEAMADPEFRLEDAGSTPSWEPQVIVAGPIVSQLRFNHVGGALKAGHRANSTVGRFACLFMRNVAGLRTPPYATDKGTIGMNFQVALAESPTTTQQLGWRTYGEDRGFAADDDVVTVQSVLALSSPIITAGRDAATHLDFIAKVVGRGLAAPWLVHGLARGHWHPLLVMSPLVAKLVAEDGFDKQMVRDHLHRTARISVAELEANLRGNGHSADFGSLDDDQRRSIAQFVPDLEAMRGRVAPYSDDEVVPTFPWPDQIGIVVAGDPLRNQSRGLLNNHNQGTPVSRAVTKPDAWRQVLSGYGLGG